MGQGCSGLQEYTGNTGEGCWEYRTTMLGLREDTGDMEERCWSHERRVLGLQEDTGAIGEAWWGYGRILGILGGAMGGGYLGYTPASHTHTHSPAAATLPLGFLGHEEPRMLWAAVAAQGLIPSARGLLGGCWAGLLHPPTPLP